MCPLRLFVHPLSVLSHQSLNGFEPNLDVHYELGILLLFYPEIPPSVSDHKAYRS